MASDAAVHVFGIRHHGPGSARSLVRALEALRPDVVLIEGPPDAADAIALAGHEEMRPPVALLVYPPERPGLGVYYPFGTFSPEWNAIRWALANGVPARFIDLPAAHDFAAALATLAEMEAHAKAAADAAASPDASNDGPSADGDADATQSPVDAGDADAAVRAGGLPDVPAAGFNPPSIADAPVDSIDPPSPNPPTIDPPTANPPSTNPPSPDPPTIDPPTANAPSTNPPAIDPQATGAPSADPPVDLPAVDPSDEETADQIRADPLEWLGRAAGFGDGERWWEMVVESRRSSEGVFAAILEAMTAVRDELARPESLHERQREAFMRQQIRAARKEGFERIAVVCGAWHAPALHRIPPAAEDAALLKGLPRAKTAATWVPWTHGRLAYESGYGAGVTSPGWYEHLWLNGEGDPSSVAVRWLTRVARLLRGEDLDASPAQVVDAARLAEAMAALRGLPLAGLPELTEACEAVFWGGAGAGALPLALIRERLIVGERLGSVPPDAPAVPLMQDLAREQKRLRLPPEASERVLELDLRKPNDLDRSRLLHRLLLLGVPWGRDERVQGRRKGTFHEHWRLRWDPELAVSLIEAGAWGNTVAEAADAKARDAAAKAPDLPALTAMLDRVLLAELPAAARALVERIGAEAARASDVAHLMGALPPLAQTLRYGSVRGPDADVLGHVVDGLAARISVGLPPAVASLDDDAAAVMAGHVDAVHGAVTLLENERHRADWLGALGRVAGQQGVHGLIAGRAVRLRLDTGAIAADEAARRMGLALSLAGEPAYGGAWIEGFLTGSAVALLHDAALWGVLDAWIAGLKGDAFDTLLPLLRRTFARFDPAERRSLGELARRGPARLQPGSSPAEATDGTASPTANTARGDAVLPLLMLILGAEASVPASAGT
ncbi:MAG TPA: DUF5682 family protein [Longimicrobium sp.]|nr:DUF5682 family protein [Longimicrobium sp.]